MRPFLHQPTNRTIATGDQFSDQPRVDVIDNFARLPILSQIGSQLNSKGYVLKINFILS